MLKKILLVTTISFWAFAQDSEDLNLMMLIGCENHSTSETSSVYDFKNAIKNTNNIPNLAILVSQSVLISLMNDCDSKCENIISELNLDLFDIYVVSSFGNQKYYLFIRKNDFEKFRYNLFIQHLRKINFDNVEKNLSSCSPYVNQNIITLLGSLFIKTKKYSLMAEPLDDPLFYRNLNIMLVGHGLTESVIAGLPINEFKEFLSFLDKYLYINTLFIDSCYVGGKNSIIAFKDTLTQMDLKYKFDVIALSSDEGVTLVSQGARSDLLNLFQLMSEYKKITEERNQDIQQTKLLKNIKIIKDKFESSLKKLFGSVFFNYLFRIYAPMIRPKNQEKWFPLFRYLNSRTINTFSITKILVDQYLTENKIFHFKGYNNIIFVSTPCVNVPILRDVILLNNKQFILRNEATYFKEIRLNLRLPTEAILTIINQVAMLFLGFTIDPDNFSQTIFIKEISFANGKANNILIYKNRDKAGLVIKLEYLGKFYQVEITGKNSFIDYNSIFNFKKIDQPYKNEYKNIEDQCLHYNTDLSHLKEHIEHKK